MEKPSKTSLIVPVVLITIGAGWLLTTLDVAPDFDWNWTLGLAVTGYLILATMGVDKFTVVLAPVLLCASVLSIFRQTSSLSLGVMIPVLVILTGILMLIARRPGIPKPRWIIGRPEESGDREG